MTVEPACIGDIEIAHESAQVAKGSLNQKMKMIVPQNMAKQ
jgi:hypothetical protein